MNIEELKKKIIFMPDATRGAVRTLTNKQMKDIGLEAVVVNTLHLLITPGPERIKQLGGIKKFMNWDGFALSDSGGFQVFSMLHSGKWDGELTDEGAVFVSPKDGTKYKLSPERSIDIQMALGTDIMVVLDDCRKATTTREEAEVSVRRTLLWARKAKDHYMNKYSDKEREGKLLTSVVQGANFLDLREKCAKELVKIGFDGYNFGGYVLNDKGDLVIEEMQCVIDNTPDDALKYAMGVGKPEDIRRTAELGYTLFDTVIPTRNARHGSLYVSEDAPDQRDGRINITNAGFAKDEGPIDPNCDCEACKNHSRAYVHQMIRVGESTGLTLATIHNLRFYQRLVEGL